MGCDGSCCAAFPINRGRDRLGDPNTTDGDLLHFMLRRLTTQEATERREAFGLTAPVVSYEYDEWFSCIYWDEESRLCSIYENRPHMCSGYPDYPGTESSSTKCDHGCDCKGAEYVPPAKPPAGLVIFTD